ncbi:MAG: hypothetical protein JXR94_07860 [Candidatus Hydrogenedentes bacterium]|nr:hypothetical protein [Candidatus Hydrogenedentota bacterium]
MPASNEDEAGAQPGTRPYEMDWAGRTEPAHPQLIDFEDLTGWRVRSRDGAEARLYRSRQERLFGEYTGKAVYSGKNARSAFVIEPPQPVPIPGEFTGVNLWVRGNNWGWVNPPATARVGVRVLVRDAKDEEYRIHLGAVDFDYWFLLHKTCVSPADGSPLYEKCDSAYDDAIDFPARFIGIEVSGCSDDKAARLHFDALCFYEMAYPPLEFEPVPSHLPWPVTEDTILPSCAADVTWEQHAEGARTVWTASKPGSDEAVLAYAYEPGDGSLSGLTARAGGQTFHPCWKGGIEFEVNGQRLRPGDAGVSARLAADDWWELAAGDAVVRYRYEFAVKGNSLIVDVAAEGAGATRFDIGLAKGLHEPKSVFFPYLTYGDDWPKVVCSDGPAGPIFLLSVLDWHHSDASALYGGPYLHEDGALGYAGGALYKPKTDGLRNPLRERLFITVSRDVHEVLPNIPNPPCDTGEMARTCLWRNIGGAFQNDMLSKYKAYGIDHFIACHHEVGWREGGESFTLRDRPAPSIGDERLAEYSAFVRGLGYRFGTYTNYVDFAPVNANWSEDAVCLNPDGTWQRAWPRCYALKPLRAAEKEAVYAPRIHERYGTTAQYCDVHTAYTPWGRTDYDARTPGAGMFRTQFNAFARLLWNESLCHHGPVFSEGNYHWFYAGIVDGNYATIVPYGRGWQFPPLVDFDLLKMHPKMTDFGMGMPLMYYGRHGGWQVDRTRLSPYLDRFCTATVAFGHIGFLATEWGFDGTLKCYYLLQALQQRYAMVPVAEIAYFDGTGLVDTSAAIATDAYRRQQVYARYENGLETWCNLSFELDWPVTIDNDRFVIPPGGFVARRPNDILVYSALYNGLHHDLALCEDYVYLDTRGGLVRMASMPRMLASATGLPHSPITARGTVAVKRDGPNAWWIIPATECGAVSIEAEWLGGDAAAGYSAQACGLDGRPVADAEVRVGDRDVTVMPVSDAAAIKYRLERRPEARTQWHFGLPRREGLIGDSTEVNVALRRPQGEDAAAPEVVCTYVAPDGAETGQGRAALVRRATGAPSVEAAVSLRVPADAEPYGRCWYRFQAMGPDGPVGDAGWMDLTAVPPFDLAFLRCEEYGRPGSAYPLHAEVCSHLPGPVEANVALEAPELAGQPFARAVRLEPGVPAALAWEVPLGHMPAVSSLVLRAEHEGHRTELQRYLCTRLTEWVVADLTKLPMTPGQCMRGQDEQPYDHEGTAAAVDVSQESLEGEQLDTIFMHPPYKGGVGYAFASFPLGLPDGHPRLEFALGFRNGSSTQDGCAFAVQVIDGDTVTEVFREQYATLNAWLRRTADLAPFAGRTVTIKLITDVGPADNSYSDWALWGAPRVVMDGDVLDVEISEERPPAQFGAAPAPLAGLTAGDLRRIASAELRLDTSGVNGGAYASFVYVNGIEIGAVPPAGSDTSWGEGAVPLTQEALASLGPRNTVVIKNPGGDYMKVRNLCLHFVLDDGRRGSSWVGLGPFCSAAGWKFAEGTAVPVGQDLPAVRLDIDVE